MDGVSGISVRGLLCVIVGGLGSVGLTFSVVGLSRFRLPLASGVDVLVVAVVCWIDEKGSSDSPGRRYSEGIGDLAQYSNTWGGRLVVGFLIS
jgi:hypothetical protein